MWVSQVSPGRKYCIRFEIAGQDRTLAWNSEECEKIWIGRRDAPNALIMRDPSVISPPPGQSATTRAATTKATPTRSNSASAASTSTSTAGDFAAPKPFPTFDDGHRDIILCDAFLESRNRAAWVRYADMA